MEALRGLKGDSRIEDLGKPYMAIASDLATGREIWLKEGSLFDAVRASVYLPGFLAPDRQPLSYVAVLSSSIEIMINQIMRSRLAVEPPHVMLNPRLGPFGKYFSLRAPFQISLVWIRSKQQRQTG